MPIPATTPPAAHAPSASRPAAKPAAQIGAHAGTVLLAGAAICAGFLAAHRIAGQAIPGCGAGGGCDKLAKGVWGSVPGLYWPVSYLGLAYFAGMLVAWLLVRGQATPGLRWLARAGALASIFFLGVMATEGTLCPYCLAAHVCNLGFWAICEMSNRGLVDRSPMRAATLSGAAVFFFVSSVLGMAEVRTKEHNARTLASAQEKMSATLPNNPSAPPPGPTGSTGATAAKPAPPTPAQGYTPAVGVQDPAKGFTGRYRLGPENAPIRIVMITDYQCPDCKHFEEQAMELVKKYPSVSLSTKHFPFCQQCNSTPNVPNLHPNACMAARAAEAAGIVYGPEGFWKMHRWLFDHSGYFQDATEFNASLRSLGFVPEEFHPVMMGAQAMANIQADITEANGLGLKSTPMMFVNGVTLDGWGADTFALKNAVEKLVAQSPQPAAPVADKPKNASQRRAEEAAAVIDQWRDTLKTPAMAWPDRKKAWTNVPDTVPLKISLWGDLLEPNCAIADKTIRDAIAGRGDIRYEFRSFPFDQTCNPELPRTMFPNGCKAAKAEEAAGQIAFAAARKRMQDWTIAHAAEVNHEALTQAAQQMGFDPDLFRTRLLGPGTGDMANRAADAAGFMAGTEAYWRVHVWIMEHQRDFSDASLRAAAPGLGLNADEWMQRMTQQDIAEIVAWDVNIGARIHIPEIPRVFVNGKVITRPLIEGQFVIERIIAEAEKMEEAKKLNAPK